MRAKALGVPNTSKAALLKHITHFRDCQSTKQCCFGSAVRPVSSTSEHHVQQDADFSSTRRSDDRLGHRAKEKLLDREFFLSLLSSASTKREAKQYLSRLKNEPKSSDWKRRPKPISSNTSTSSVPSSTLRSGVNLGSFYGVSRAVYDTPVFMVDPNSSEKEVRDELGETLHLALVKITRPQFLDDHTLDGVAKTLSQLTRLGLSCCVVVDPGMKQNDMTCRKLATEQAFRIARAVDGQPSSKAVCLDFILSVSGTEPLVPCILLRKALLNPLSKGQIAIVAPVAYTEESARAVTLPANEVILALTKEFAGLAAVPHADEDPLVTAQRISALQREVAVDRVIILDPLGGVPAFNGPQRSHVFINLEQEFNDIENELTEMKKSVVADAQAGPTMEGGSLSHTSQTATVPVADSAQDRLHAEGSSSDVFDGHLDNLRLSQKVLSLLPSSSSGIITSPDEVAESAQTPPGGSDFSMVGTRRQRNPLIHSLLTDKPMLSSSLPPARRGPAKWPTRFATQPMAQTTFVKRGMPLTIFPDPRVQIWSPDAKPRVRLDDSCVDLPRLVHLIEDSFNRKLDVQDYLNRINGRIAGLIIAGEYEGGAVLTWETPPGVEDDGSDASTARMVPYLDKFAVLKRSQGAGGVADIVFNAMVRTCFPNGVCWRSRKDNPVNKWYFERSQGTWKLSDSNWTMFWTTPGLPEDSQKLRDYEAVCRNIQPSWADKKGVVD